MCIADFKDRIIICSVPEIMALKLFGNTKNLWTCSGSLVLKVGPGPAASASLENLSEM